MKKVLSAALLAASAMIAPVAAHASIGHIYEDETSFLSHTGSTQYDFSAYPSGHTSVTDPFTLGPETISSDGNMTVNNFFSGTLTSDGSVFTIAQSSGYSVGFFAVGNPDQIISILMDGLYTFNLVLDDSGVGFWGIKSEVPVTSLQLSQAVEVSLLHIDSDADAAPQVAATPEPSSIALLGTGVLGVAGAARRRFRRS